MPSLLPPFRTSVLILILCVTVGAAIQARGSAWIMITEPTLPAAAMNTVAGYTARSSFGLEHLENVPTFKQIGLFSGVVVFPDLYFLRPLHAWIASLIVPVTGARGALRVLNILWWWAAGLLAWTVVAALGGDLWSRVIALALVLGGSGCLAHVADLSTHTLSFLLFWVAAAWMARALRVTEGFELRDHVCHGIVLGLAGLVYNSSLYILAAYVAATAGRSRFRHVAVTAGIAVAIPAAWELTLMGAMYVAAPGRASMSFLEFYRVYALRNTEGQYLQSALATWRQLGGNPVSLAIGLSKYTLEFALFDSPAAIAAAIASALFLSRLIHFRAREVMVVACLSVLPFAGALAWAPSSTARGYLVYGATAIMYVLIAIAASVWRRTAASARGRALRSCVIVAGLVVHVAWNASYLWGERRPLNAYMYGVRPMISSWSRPTKFVSLTGAEPVPVMLGGRADWEAAGLDGSVPAPARVSPNLFVGPVTSDSADPRAAFVVPDWGLARRLVASVAARAFVGGLIVLALICARPARPVTAFTVAVIMVVSAVATARIPPLRLLPSYVHNAFGFALGAGTRVDYRVTLAPELLRELSDAVRPGDRIQLVSPGAINVGLAVDSARRVSARSGLFVSPTTLVSLVDQTRTLTMSLTALGDSTAFAPCWQRLGLAQRQLESTGAPASARCLPAVEIRVIDPSGGVVMIAF